MNELLKQLANHFDLSKLKLFLSNANNTYKPRFEDFNHYLDEDSLFKNLQKEGQIEYPDASRLAVLTCHVEGEITRRSSKQKQYAIAKKIIKAEKYDAAIFVFYDDEGHFRFSLVKAQYLGTRQEFTNFRRYTYFVSPELSNKTFLTQVSKADFSSIESLLNAFSLEAVSDEFYREFQPHFQALAGAVQGTDDQELKNKFALLFVIRIIFLGFVQKKKWLGENTSFLQDFLAEYQHCCNKQDLFYRDWLTPLFFEALNQPPGYHAYSGTPFSDRTKKALIMSPFLNGELFKRKTDVDTLGFSIPDLPIEDFMAFLFQYNFTIEENDLYDEELELNPEFLGLIFERLVNKEDGAVYTPRTEVDLMCRLGLVKWLEKNNNTSIALNDLYNYVFRNMGSGEEYDEFQKQGDFSPAQIRDLIELLEKITVCDPAAGSGAFEVGMLQVLAELIENLYQRTNAPDDIKSKIPSDFELKKKIIANSLYGVEVKRSAVWINQLRLWLTLFVDMPNSYNTHTEPLLPNLAFKVRVGDSLVQRIGTRTFPVYGVANLPHALGVRLGKLKERKRQFFYNSEDDYQSISNEELHFFQAIIDAQIDEKRVQLSHVMQPRPKQTDWLNEDRIEQLELAEQKENQQLRETLNQEITTLREEQKALVERRPFIWSMEFSEIFIDRGGFDIIIGNPPYVRQESIGDPNNNMAPTDYKNALRDLTLMDFPFYFAKSKREPQTFKKNKRPSGRSDLYTFFYIHSLRLLHPKGVHIFICSNAWLDVGYGAWLQEFLLSTTPTHFVIDNHAKRSFASSDINTIITLLGAPCENFQDEEPLRFVAFKRAFEDVIYAENLLAIQNAQKTLKTEDYRVFPISTEDLLREGSEDTGQAGVKNYRYIGDKWGGKYLRAPDIYFTILEKGAGKLKTLGKIATINEGRPTGANNYFFITEDTAENFNIERKYLLPGVMKTRDMAFLEIDIPKVDRLFLKLPADISIIKSENVKEYFNWGKKNILPYSKTLKAKKRWWYFAYREPADLIAPCGYGDRVWCSVNSAKAITSNSYTEMRFISKENIPSVFYLINHPIGWLFLEILGRVSLGGGMIKVDPIEYRKMPIIDLNDIHLKIPFERKVENVFTESGLDPLSKIPIDEQDPIINPDRKEFDDLIFNMIGLSIEERKDVYRAICKMVWERISKATNI